MAYTPSCSAHLAGWIVGDTWTRWRVNGCGQVRFWLRPTTGPVGCGSLLCAVPVRSARELRAACDTLAEGMFVEIAAELHGMLPADAVRDESRAGVCFVARELSVAGLPFLILQDRKEDEPEARPEPLASHHVHRIGGKMAAAGEREEAA